MPAPTPSAAPPPDTPADPYPDHRHQVGNFGEQLWPRSFSAISRRQLDRDRHLGWTYGSRWPSTSRRSVGASQRAPPTVLSSYRPRFTVSRSTSSGDTSPDANQHDAVTAVELTPVRGAPRAFPSLAELTEQLLAAQETDGPIADIESD